MTEYWPFGAMAGAAALAGVVWTQLPEGRTFALPAAEARAILRQTELPDGIYGSAPTAGRPLQLGDGTIVWKLRIGNEEALRYTATVLPIDRATTRVAVELSAPPSGRHATAIAARLRSHPEVRDFYLAAMEEQVAAALERRPVQFDRLLPSMAKAMASTMGETVTRFDEAAAGFEARDRANRERAYREEARGSFGEENDPTENERFD